jgi:hypothetical protein
MPRVAAWIIRSVKTGRLVAVLGVATAVAGVVLVLWPLHADGLRGNALLPRYSGFGWYSYTPMPARVTMTDLRRAGVRTPYDVVDERRRLAGGIVAGGLVLAGAVAVASARAATDG